MATTINRCATAGKAAWEMPVALGLISVADPQRCNGADVALTVVTVPAHSDHEH
jgi:hypothetical protein